MTRTPGFAHVSHPSVPAAKKAYTYDELAELVGLSRRTLRNHVDAGKLIPVYPTGEPRFTEAEVDRWIKSWPAEPPAKTKTA